MAAAASGAAGAATAGGGDGSSANVGVAVSGSGAQATTSATTSGQAHQAVGGRGSTRGHVVMGVDKALLLAARHSLVAAAVAVPPRLA